MKGDRPRVLLLGNNSGNNLGDAAIMSSIMESVKKEVPDAEFYIPSIKPQFINDNYGEKYDAHGLSAWPWNLALRLFGLPTILAMKKCDVALICDGIIFGKKFLNPAFNMLVTLLPLIPFSKLLKCPLVCHACGIGPFPDKYSDVAARKLIDYCDMVSFRDEDSQNLAKEIGVTNESFVTGDPAFINPVSSQERAKEVFAENNISMSKPIFGINVTSYIDGWLTEQQKVSSKEGFLDEVAAGVKEANRQMGDAFQPVVFSVQPMDDEFCGQLAEKLDTVVIGNSTYLSHDIMAALRECKLFCGMRFHSIVLPLAVNTPVIALNYAPKVIGIMRLMNCAQYCLELNQTTKESLSSLIVESWNNIEEISQNEFPVVDELKKGAHLASERLVQTYLTANTKGDSSSSSRPLSASL